MNASPQTKAPKHQADLDLVDAALDGDEKAVAKVVGILDAGKIRAALLKRGASASEADELLGDLSGDCFGGHKAKGGLHRLLAKFNGACPLEGYLQRVAINRLISLKRKQKPVVELDAGAGDDATSAIDLPDSGNDADSEDRIVELIREAIFDTFAAAEPEQLVIFRLVHSYKVPQKRVGELWGWHESKVSRALSSLQDALRSGIMKRIQERDPWLEIEWADFLKLCSQSIDLFGSEK
ncbi:RNA polymerase sigma factor [Haloferula sp.]|uniref:RNA polymerase sigma factor n=1 Tax=Haloferula sp. TaxID=2497595 RepID=UPI00329F1C45